AKLRMVASRSFLPIVLGNTFRFVNESGGNVPCACSAGTNATDATTRPMSSRISRPSPDRPPWKWRACDRGSVPHHEHTVHQHVDDPLRDLRWPLVGRLVHDARGAEHGDAGVRAHLDPTFGAHCRHG